MVTTLVRALGAAYLLGVSAIAVAKPVTPSVIMDFQALTQPVIAANGTTLAYVAQPDRGEPVGHLQRIGGNLFRVVGGHEPQISADGQYGLFRLGERLLEQENRLAHIPAPTTAVRLLVDSQTGQQVRFEHVKQAWFTADSNYLLLLHGHSSEAAPNAPKEGTTLTIRDLRSGATRVIGQVWQVALAENAAEIAYSVRTKDGSGNGIYWLNADFSHEVVHEEAGFISGDLTISDDGQLLAFSWGNEAQPKRQRAHQLGLYQRNSKVRWHSQNHADFLVTGFSQLTFSSDKQRLFVGRQAQRPQLQPVGQYPNAAALTNLQQLQAKANVVLWHGDDASIKPHEQQRFADEYSRQYLAVWHLDNNNFVQLADPYLEGVDLPQSNQYGLGYSDLLYRKIASWAGEYRDWYLINLRTGARQLLVTQGLKDDVPTLSPDGRAVAWYVRGELYWHDVASGLTTKLGGGFAQEEYDLAGAVPSYGFGPWLSGNNGVLVYDKYDVHQLQAGTLRKLTEGRLLRTRYRVIEEDNAPLDPNLPIPLHSVNELNRAEGLHYVQLASGELTTWQHGEQRIRFVAKAQQAQNRLYSQESYHRYPDLYLAPTPEAALTQVTFLGNQLTGLNWGNASLVQWQDGSGAFLQGTLVTPAAWDGATRLPTVVVLADNGSERVHQFPSMTLSEPLNLAWYASEGYAILMPDIRYQVGQPSKATHQSLMPAIERLVQLGVTDPQKIGLYGHGWGGYQGVQLATLTDAFAAVVAGAPTANLTSAYASVQLREGVGRQYQYEQGAGRMSRSLYDAPERYIENSPVFQAKKINTPLLLMTGDQDEVVPWQQGIELYLAMRRLAKPIVMLQYEAEGHQLAHYPNKVDYALRSKAFLDFTLKGKNAPNWWLNGRAWSTADPLELD